MTQLVNRLIARAKGGAAELTIPPNRISSLATHVRLSDPCAPSQPEIESMIVAGRLRLLGVPVRVLGKP